jgi:hypothetical protein
MRADRSLGSREAPRRRSVLANAAQFQMIYDWVAQGAISN